MYNIMRHNKKIMMNKKATPPTDPAIIGMVDLRLSVELPVKFSNYAI